MDCIPEGLSLKNLCNKSGGFSEAKLWPNIVNHGKTNGSKALVAIKISLKTPILVNHCWPLNSYTSF